MPATPNPMPPYPNALILAAGRGERMRPLTDVTPKPLLPVRGKPLMQWPLEALARAGCTDVVINTAWLGHQIPARFGDVFTIQPPSNGHGALSIQEQWPNPSIKRVALHYSHEGQDFGAALETAGGVARALPWLCPAGTDGVFWVVAGDVYAPDFAFSAEAVDAFRASTCLAHLWLVPNPSHCPRGDFGLAPAHAPGVQLALNRADSDPGPRFTFSTIALYRAELFAPPWCDIPAGNPHGQPAKLAPLLRRAMDQGRVSAELYTGRWHDIGTPERLQAVQQDAPPH